jgi:hypothetical protein
MFHPRSLLTHKSHSVGVLLEIFSFEFQLLDRRHAKISNILRIDPGRVCSHDSRCCEHLARRADVGSHRSAGKRDMVTLHQHVDSVDLESTSPIAG